MGCYLDLGLPGANAGALDADTGPAVDDMGNPHPLGRIGDVLSLPHLPLIAAEVVVLHAEDAMDRIEGTLQGRRIGQVGLDDLGAELGEGAGLLCFGVPGQGPNPLMVLQQAAGHRTPLQAGRPTTAMIRASCCAIAVAPSQDKLERQDPNELRHGRLLSPLRRWNAPWGGVADHNTRRLQPLAWPPVQLMERSHDLAAHRGDPRRLSKRTVG